MSRDGRPTTEGQHAVDVRWLARQGYFAGAMRSSALTWTRTYGCVKKEAAGSAHLTATSEGLSLRYTVTDSWTGERTEHAPYVALEWTACRYGGRRPWFLCPACRLRCAVLYLRGRTACRTCHGL